MTSMKESAVWASVPDIMKRSHESHGLIGLTPAFSSSFDTLRICRKGAYFCLFSLRITG